MSKADIFISRKSGHFYFPFTDDYTTLDKNSQCVLMSFDLKVNLVFNINFKFQIYGTAYFS